MAREEPEEKTLKLSNVFHNTEVFVATEVGDFIHAETLKEIQNLLCPEQQCRCGGIDKHIDHTRGSRYGIKRQSDGRLILIDRDSEKELLENDRKMQFLMDHGYQVEENQK